MHGQILFTLLSVLIIPSPEVWASLHGKPVKVQYQYFDDYLMSIATDGAKENSHNSVPKPSTSHPSFRPTRPTSEPRLSVHHDTSDDEDYSQASGVGDSTEQDAQQHPIPEFSRQEHKHTQVNNQTSDFPQQQHEYHPHHRRHPIPTNLPLEQQEMLKEEEQEQEDKEKIMAGQEGDETQNLDLLNYFKDVPREHWSCCMLGKLAGDKGFHCHAGFYAARVTIRNPNRAHNAKMLWHGRDRVPTWGWDIIRTFQRCVERHAAEFHKCCFAANIERRERTKWTHYRQQNMHQIASPNSKETEELVDSHGKKLEQTNEGLERSQGHSQERHRLRHQQQPQSQVRPSEGEAKALEVRENEERAGQPREQEEEMSRLMEQERRMRARRRRQQTRRQQQS